MKPIFSFTLKDLYDSRDASFIHHDDYTKDLLSKSEAKIKYVYANTIVLEVKSAQYGETVKLKNGGTGTNNTVYTIFILFEDFYTIGKDKDIDFEDAIDYALNYGDVHIRCNCPAFLYWGYAYIGTQLKYIYGIPHENRYPHIRNPNVKGSICKHCDSVIQYCLKHKTLISDMFAAYYDRLASGQSIYAVNANGNTITIGHKDEDGDIFFERQEAEMKEVEEELKAVKDLENEDVDQTDPDSFMEDMEDVDDNVIEGE